jgi:aryl-alcohol dehydrogenase-like predicted oxidoreductase
MQVALAWLLQRAPNILLIPGTSSRTHLAENIAAAELVLPAEALRTLDNIATRRALTRQAKGGNDIPPQYLPGKTSTLLAL